MTKTILIFLLTMLIFMCGSKSFAQVSKYQKAAEQGNAEAQYSVGLFYRYGDGGVKKDMSKAVYWYRKAADQGHTGAACDLGVMYEYGDEGFPKDPAKAVYWYRKAAELGSTAAQIDMARCYEFGKLGITIDPVKAVYWYRKAAEQGDFGGQYCLGECYQFGKGVKKDSAKAVYWYRKAAAQGSYVAEKKLEQFKDMPIVIDFAIDKAILTINNGGDEDDYEMTDVNVLRIYRYGKIEYGNKQKMIKLTTFTRAEPNLINLVELSEDFKGVSVTLYIDELLDVILIVYSDSLDKNNNKEIIFACNEKEKIKLKKIYELVKQNRFITEEW